MSSSEITCSLGGFRKAVAEHRPPCACGRPIRGRYNTTCSACVLAAARERRQVLVDELGRTGLTETARSLSSRLASKRVGDDLRAMIKVGVVARSGDRYFPPSWAPLARATVR